MGTRSMTRGSSYGVAAGTVGRFVPGRLAGGGASQSVTFSCVGITSIELPSIDAGAALALFPLQGERTTCGIPCDYTHNKLARGELGIAAFFFQPSDDATDDRVQSDHARNRGPRCSANQCLSSDTTGRD